MKRFDVYPAIFFFPVSEKLATFAADLFPYEFSLALLLIRNDLRVAEMKKKAAKNRNEATLEWLRNEVYNDAIDIGSRDGKLIKAINASNRFAIDFHNAVNQGGVQFLKHDLENGIPLKTSADPDFDLIIANDVIEHVENKSHLIDQIFERSRRHVVISLPNTQHYKYVVGLIRGKMSKQYEFMVPDKSDRHRWITYYSDNVKFVEGAASKRGFSIVGYSEVFRPHYLRSIAGLLPRTFTVFNQIFLCEKAGSGPNGLES